MRALAERVLRRARRPRIPASLPPGPKLPVAAQVALFLYQPFALLRHCRRRYGPTFTLELARDFHLVVLSRPEDVREVFTASPHAMYGGIANEPLRPAVGEASLLLLDGERHLRERRLLLPPFHGERMHRYGEIMRALTEREVARWPRDRVLAIHPPLQVLTLDVILRTVFGVDEGATMDEMRAAITALADAFGATAMIPALQVDLGPRSPWGRFVRARRDADALLHREIAARRASPSGARDDILSLLLDARYEDGAGLSDAELRDELMTLLAAGHETTATVLPWVLHHLSEHRDVQARVHAEIDRRAPELPYLDAVIKESMRLCPVIGQVGRVLQEPRRFGSWELPAGTLVSPSIYLAHRDPESWPRPERFEPERFLDARVSPYAYFPFGGGVRRCIGMAFASYEMRVVLATILARVRVEPAPGVRIRPTRRGVTIAPSGRMPLVLRAR